MAPVIVINSVIKNLWHLERNISVLYARSRFQNRFQANRPLQTIQWACYKNDTIIKSISCLCQGKKGMHKIKFGIQSDRQNKVVPRMAGFSMGHACPALRESDGLGFFTLYGP